MSKLAELIRKATGRDLAPIGFRTRARTHSASLLIVARVGSAAGVAGAVKAGADVVLLAVESAKAGNAELKRAVEAAGTAALGLWVQAAGSGDVIAAREAGIDHLVFGDEHTAAEVLLDDKLGLVLSLEEGLGDTHLRTIESLGLEALLVAYWEGVLTVRRQLELTRLAGLARKPLLLSVTADISAQQLEALRDAGVVGVVVEAEPAPAGVIATLRERIAGLPPRRRRRPERFEALVPAAAPSAHEHEEEDDDY